MKLALECRTNMLEMVQPFADFDFILAHKVLEDEAYAEWYNESTNLKIVDNSVNELGTPVSIEGMKEAFEKVNGTYVVAPDFLGDAKKTVESYIECTKVFPKERVIGVVQGSTFEEAFECLPVYQSGIISVPYDLCSQKTDPPLLMAIRRALFIGYMPKDKGFVVHLLGFNGLEEFFWYQNAPFVASIDTGIPVLLGLQGLDILDPLESKVEPTLNLMEKLELTQQCWTGIIRNIALLRKWLP